MVVCEQTVDRAYGRGLSRIKRDGGDVVDRASGGEPSGLVDTLMELMALPGPTGQEEPVLAWCRERWSARGAERVSTPIGNVLARVGGRGPRLLIQGHADEIGFVVK